MSLKPHHQAWLNAHPNHNEVWMLTAISAGFDVHHVDQDKENNDPDNLLMIERDDHMKIHGMVHFLNKKDNPSWDSYAKRISLGESGYNMRSNTNMSWLEIAQKLGYKKDGQAINVTKAYASYHKLQWPIPHHAECKCRPCGNGNYASNKRKRAADAPAYKYTYDDELVECPVD